MNSALLQAVIDDLVAREERGKTKYNTTMDRDDLSHEEWLQHAYEEALDMALYLKKAMQQTKSYSHDEVQNIVRNAVNATTRASINWFVKEHDIVDKETNEEVTSVKVIKSENQRELIDYVTEELANNGIRVKFSDKDSTITNGDVL